MEHGVAPKAILPFPYQNGLTRALRTASAKQGNSEFLSLWAGQGVRMARQCSAGELLDRIGEEAERALARVSKA
jgi:nitronate monooxygenase